MGVSEMTGKGVSMDGGVTTCCDCGVSIVKSFDTARAAFSSDFRCIGCDAAAWARIDAAVAARGEISTAATNVWD